ARCTMRTHSARSRLPIAPNIIAPRQSRLTRMPERPRLSKCLGGPPQAAPRSARRRVPQPRRADRSEARGERELDAFVLEVVGLGLVDVPQPVAPVDLALEGARERRAQPDPAAEQRVRG